MYTRCPSSSFLIFFLRWLCLWACSTRGRRAQSQNVASPSSFGTKAGHKQKIEEEGKTNYHHGFNEPLIIPCNYFNFMWSLTNHLSMSNPPKKNLFLSYETNLSSAPCHHPMVILMKDFYHWCYNPLATLHWEIAKELNLCIIIKSYS